MAEYGGGKEGKSAVFCALYGYFALKALSALDDKLLFIRHFYHPFLHFSYNMQDRVILLMGDFAVKLVFYEVEDISYHKVGGVFYPLLFRLNAHFLKPFMVFVKLLDVGQKKLSR